MSFSFKKAEKKKSKLRIALIGPSGSGKTYSALAIATEMARQIGTKIAVIDTENGSAELYADEFAFDVLNLDSFSPYTYVEAIKAAESAGFGIIVIDSLSHAWMGKDGALEMADNETRKSRSGNSYTAWRNVTPAHNSLVDAIIQSGSHVIATMRAKTEYVQEKDDKGKTVIRKVGLAPIQREGLDFEFSVVGDIDLDHILTITKSRCKVLADKVIRNPGAPMANALMTWLNSGVAEDPKPAPVKAAPPANDDAPTSHQEPRTQLDDSTIATIIASIDASTTQDDLKAARGDAARYKAQMNATQYQAVVDAVNAASKRIKQGEAA